MNRPDHPADQSPDAGERRTTKAARSTGRSAGTWALALAAASWALVGCASATGPETSPTPAPSSAESSPSVSSPSVSSPSVSSPPVSSPPAATPAATATPATPAAPSSTAAEPEAPAEGVTVEIELVGGKVTSTVQTVKVPVGEKVTIRGVSDVADSLHVHGYDKSLDLKPGKPAKLTFTADVEGVFEIETHETEKLVAKLTVS